MKQRLKLLWLVSWYPNKYDSFDGDFIQRHAMAAALYHDVHVLFIKENESQTTIEETVNQQAGLIEQIIYLPKKKTLLGKGENFYQWWQFSQKKVQAIFHQQKPDIAHVHVPWKAGLLALWIKKKYKIPYLVTEHWGIYNTVVEDNISKRSALTRFLLKRIYKKSSAFLSVSSYLGNGVNKMLVKKEFAVIPNVVDTTLFKPLNKKQQVFTFLHVSNMVSLKNVEGIINSFALFLQHTNATGQLVLVGRGSEPYQKLASSLGLLNKSVFFRGELSYAAVAAEMQAADVLIVNSDIENSPCVIGEALCCGVPVIATNVGGIPELLTEKNSRLIPPRSNPDLSEAMEWFDENRDRFDSATISSSAQAIFSPERIGQTFSDVYLRILKMAGHF